MALMLTIWLGTLALSLSPVLHELLHHDSHSPNHECLVTQLDKGQVLASFTPTIAPPPNEAGLTLTPMAKKASFPGADYRLSPSRAPPIIRLFPRVVG